MGFCEKTPFPKDPFFRHRLFSATVCKCRFFFFPLVLDAQGSIRHVRIGFLSLIRGRLQWPCSPPPFPTLRSMLRILGFVHATVRADGFVSCVGPAPLQICVGDFCGVNFGGKNPATKSAENPAAQKSISAKTPFCRKTTPTCAFFGSHLNASQKGVGKKGYATHIFCGSLFGCGSPRSDPGPLATWRLQSPSLI